MFLYLLGGAMVLFGLYCMASSSDVSGPGMRAGGLGIAGVGSLISSFGSAEKMLGGIFFSLVVIGISALWFKCIYDKENRQMSPEELQQIQKEYREAVQSQQAKEPWATRYATSPCAHCGHYKVRSAKWEDKSNHILFWGATSEKIGTNYKCEHCGRMW